MQDFFLYISNGRLFIEVKSSSDSVRWRPGQKENLNRIAEIVGLERIDLIRAAVDALVAYVDAHGGKLLLPLDFSQTFLTFEMPRKTGRRGNPNKRIPVLNLKKLLLEAAKQT